MSLCHKLNFFSKNTLHFDIFILNKMFVRNWVFATNSDVLIPVSLQPNVVDLRNFKLGIMLDLINCVWNIKGLHHHFAKIIELKQIKRHLHTDYLSILIDNPGFISFSSVRIGFLYFLMESISELEYLCYLLYPPPPGTRAKITSGRKHFTYFPQGIFYGKNNFPSAKKHCISRV